MSNLFPIIIRRLGPPIQCQQIRYLPRWSHRRPVRVIAPEEYDEARDTQKRKSMVNVVQKENFQEPQTQQPIVKVVRKQNFKVDWKKSSGVSTNLQIENKGKSSQPKKKSVKPLSISKAKEPKKETIDLVETVIDEDGNYIYTKLKDNDSRVSSLLVEVKSKKEKEKKDLVLLEGKRIIKDALDAGCKLEYLLFSRKTEVEYLKPSLPKSGAKLYKMPYRELQLWSDLTTTPGIMGIFKIPDTESFRSTDSIPLTIICDNIREPSNLGAILRTCSGVGCETVILTKGCVNVWDPKVIRSASGSHFKLHIMRRLSWNDVKERLPPQSSIYIADNKRVFTDEESELQNLEEKVQNVPVLPYYGVDFGSIRHAVLIIGGETEGISAESYELAAEFNGVRLNVPLSNEVDSLNTGTALGIIAFEIKRQLLRSREVEHEYLSPNVGSM